MDLKLDDGDVTLLRTILEQHLGNFRMEIRDTEDYEMRKRMHADEDRLKAILARLGSTVV